MKPWYKSRTVWVNSVAGVALLVQTYTGFVIDAETQAAILVVVNLVLRAITKEALGA